MQANLYSNCVLIKEVVKAFLIEIASELRNDREAKQDVTVSDNDGCFPSTRTCCYVLLRRLHGLASTFSWMPLGVILQGRQAWLNANGAKKVQCVRVWPIEPSLLNADGALVECVLAECRMPNAECRGLCRWK